MNHNLDRSLCQDCRFEKTCSLTANKNFIWSCSEYEIIKIDTKEETIKNVQKIEQVLNEPTVVFI